MRNHNCFAGGACAAHGLKLCPPAQAAAPVGQWALRQGVKAAIGLMAAPQSRVDKERDERKGSQRRSADAE